MKDKSLAEKDAMFNRTVIYKQFYNYNPLKASFSGWTPSTEAEQGD